MVFAVCFFAAALFGALAAVYLRRRHRAWTWGLLTLIPLMPIAALLVFGAVSLTTALAPFALSLGAAFGAVGWGVHTRLEDRRAGGDREVQPRGGAAFLTPFAAGSSSAAVAQRGFWPRACRSAAPGAVSWHASGAAAAGSGCHVLIPGATGAGKTTSLAALLVEYVARSGFGAVVLEAKIDRALREAAQGAAAARGVPFHLFLPTAPSGYDPLASRLRRRALRAPDRGGELGLRRCRLLPPGRLAVSAAGPAHARPQRAGDARLGRPCIAIRTSWRTWRFTAAIRSWSPRWRAGTGVCAPMSAGRSPACERACATSPPRSSPGPGSIPSARGGAVDLRESIAQPRGRLFPLRHRPHRQCRPRDRPDGPARPWRRSPAR